MHAARTLAVAAHDRRLAALRSTFAAAHIDALLVTHLPNVFYLSGFTGTAASLLITEQAQHFITDFRYHGWLGTEVQGPWELADNSSRKLAEVLASLDVRGRLEVEAERLPVAEHGRLASRDYQLVQTAGLVEGLRMVKDAAELDCLRRAARVGAEVFRELLPLLQLTTTEADIAAEIEYRARKHGATATSFKPIIASGVRSALPHAGFTSQTLQPAVPTVIDMGVVLDGYCSDMTRTVFLGDCPSQWQALYELVDAARATAQAVLRPGITGAGADAVARGIIAGRGYAEQFGHGLGHGVGIEIHEAPRLVSSETRELQPGHVVTCEPGVYLPGEGGIRIENLCAITADGVENLTPLGTELLVL